MKATASQFRATDAAEQFRAAIQAAGLTPPDEIVTDENCGDSPAMATATMTPGFTCCTAMESRRALSAVGVVESARPGGPI
jgi:hypothetical protein